MNISLNWLTDYVEVAMPTTELEQLFTCIGLNHEGTTETPADLVLDLEELGPENPSPTFRPV